jgi:hypothetical protein
MNSRQTSPQGFVPFVDSIVQGDCRELVQQLPDECLDAVITSPPYYQQRDYGVGDIGNEPTLDAYIQNLLQVFEQCVRCLKPTGSIFFNIGDKHEGSSLQLAPYLFAHAAVQRTGVKLINVITWVKPNPEPRQYRRRLVSSTEPIFHFVKSDEYRYFYERFMAHRDMTRQRVKAGNNIGKQYMELIQRSDLSPERPSSISPPSPTDALTNAHTPTLSNTPPPRTTHHNNATTDDNPTTTQNCAPPTNDAATPQNPSPHETHSPTLHKTHPTTTPTSPPCHTPHPQSLSAPTDTDATQTPTPHAPRARPTHPQATPTPQAHCLASPPRCAACALLSSCPRHSRVPPLCGGRYALTVHR